MKTLTSLLGGFALSLGLVVGPAGPAAADTPIRFILDWKFEGPAAPFLVAQQKGYFKAEGIDVTIDSGNGSVGAVTRVAGGSYDIGAADFGAMLEFNEKNPDKALTAVFMIYDAPPSAIFTLKKSGLARPGDLKGKTLGAPIFDAARKMFPAFAGAVGLTPADVTWTTMEPALREPMLVRGDVDAISGFTFTSLLNLRANGVPESDVTVFTYSGVGLKLYGNVLIPSPELRKEHPEALKGFLRAVVKGWRDTVADPSIGVAALTARDPLIDPALELERLKMAIAQCVNTADVKADGMGAVRADRLAVTVEQVAQAFGFQSTPSPDTAFDASFLPAKDERMLPLP
ncbi:ABC transporter substrate-binding protein [Azospirillum sp. ST 5-10]|uniref:ABC transporter substrate-binding protein n=1 Tax=unclassified Azospirillum TaxID=2630922 RepID=UPI003F4A074E